MNAARNTFRVKALVSLSLTGSQALQDWAKLTRVPESFPSYLKLKDWGSGLAKWGWGINCPRCQGFFGGEGQVQPALGVGGQGKGKTGWGRQGKGRPMGGRA